MKISIDETTKCQVMPINNYYFFIFTYNRDNVVEVLFFFGEMSKIIHTQEASFDFYQFLGKSNDNDIL